MDDAADSDRPPKSERELQKEQFASIFGVTEDELEVKGIDTTEYARAHVHELIRDSRNWDRLGVPPADQAELHSLAWAWWCWVTLFVAIGFLFLYKVRPLHWLAIPGASLSLVIGLGMYIRGFIYHRRSRRGG